MCCFFFKDEKINLTEESLEFHAMGKGAQGHNSYAFHIDFYLPVNCEVRLLKQDRLQSKTLILFTNVDQK